MNKLHTRRVRLLFILCFLFFASLKSSRAETNFLTPEEAQKRLKVANGLQVKTFASEPGIVSISNIDVDHRGRVWACEAINYRHNNGKRPEGDRILILEDTDGDGTSDKTTVFYQGRDIDIPMGLCVLGNKVIVSVSPEILLLEDTDGDDKADKKTVLFTSDADFQHDHSLHSFVFGPDGRFYANFGNTGNRLKDVNGKTIVDILGRNVQADGKPYLGGMVFRCDRDFKNIEVLGHNFRNNYEATVDSFGNVWQSDNDDDGNLAVRFNYILEGGNYGYLDEMTQERWQKRRIGDDARRWMRHWHQNDPGSVPNILLTGNGAPTCMTIYEGRLLPKIFWDQALHCDAGPHAVRAFPVSQTGAGFSASIVDILKTDDPNCRPIDVAVATDGSLFVSDWYDPVVGGFLQNDIQRGRIYWIAPQGHKYAPPKYDFDTTGGLMQALQSPNYCARHLAWTELHKLQTSVEAPLTTLLADKNPRIRARALWLLARIKGREDQFINHALADSSEHVRVVGLRLAQMLNRNPLKIISKLSQDPSPRVRAECAVNLRFHNRPSSGKIWAQLAVQHDGKDRWYLEALGIGAAQNWDSCLNQWLSIEKNWNTRRGRDLIWRSRSLTTPLLLTKIIASEAAKGRNTDRFVRALDFQTSPSKHKALELLVFGTIDGRRTRLDWRTSLAIANRLIPEKVKATRRGLQPLIDLLRSAEISDTYLELVDRYHLADFYPSILRCAQHHHDKDLRNRAMNLLLDKRQFELIGNALQDEDLHAAQAAFAGLASSYHAASIDLVLAQLGNHRFQRELLRSAARELCEFPQGADKLMDLTEQGRLAADLKEAVAPRLLTNGRDKIRERAKRLFPMAPSKNEKPLPDLLELVKLPGDPVNGKSVFQKHGKCADCHKVGSHGKSVGPDLSQIGKKLGRVALYETILYPSAGINHSYDTFSVTLSSGRVVSGILINQNDDEVSIRLEDASTQTFRRSDIDEISRQNISLMPADLHKLMTVTELSDVVAYLTTLNDG